MAAAFAKQLRLGARKFNLLPIIICLLRGSLRLSEMTTAIKGGHEQALYSVLAEVVRVLFHSLLFSGPHRLLSSRLSLVPEVWLFRWLLRVFDPSVLWPASEQGNFLFCNVQLQRE